jgi:hypothetical protein
MLFTTIGQVERFFTDDPVAKQHVETLIDAFIRAKNPSIAKAGVEPALAYLKSFPFLQHDTERSVQLDFDCLAVSYVLMQVAEKTMGEKLPQEIIPALQFVDRFAEEIRKPAIRTHWYGSLELEFEGFVLTYFHQVHGFDITNFILNLTEEQTDEEACLRSIDMTYQHSFGYLSDTVEECFATLITMLGSDRTKDAADGCITHLCKFDPTKAANLFEYAKQHGGSDYPYFLSALNIGLFHTDEDHYQQESENLFTVKPWESIQAIAWIPYTNALQIARAYDFVLAQPTTDVEVLKKVVIFYARVR